MQNKRKRECVSGSVKVKRAKVSLPDKKETEIKEIWIKSLNFSQDFVTKLRVL